MTVRATAGSGAKSVRNYIGYLSALLGFAERRDGCR
jgi:hypothetical protein